MAFLLTPIARILDNTVVFTWDAFLVLANLVLPKSSVGHVVPSGAPGFGGKWPEHKPPTEADSRSCCPGLNAMANHGILPRDGRNISFKEMTKAVRESFNFAPSFCYFASKYAADTLGKSYDNDRFDLEEISMHNGIEHDASLTRLDNVFDKDQGIPHLPYVRELLDSASGKDKDGNVLLTPRDIANISAKRRAESRASNPSYKLDLNHRMFSSSNNCTLLTIFGGRYKDVEIFLTEERIPDGWECRVRKSYGLTIAALNMVSIPVELRTKEKAKQLMAEAQHEHD
jgi:hypothetical protein